MLAFSNWLVVLNDNADICHFTDSESHINVNYDYVVDTVIEEHEDVDIDEFTKRVYSNNDYSIKGDSTDMQFLEKVKNEFHNDTTIE